MHPVERGTPLGRVVGLWRYPVKSMAGEALCETGVSWHGLEADRRWALLRNDVPRSGFPWLTQRECPQMGGYRPWFADAASPATSALQVRAPTGEDFDIADPALGRALVPEGVRAIKQDRGIFDTFAISLISTRTLASLGQHLGTELDPRRFRPNVLVEADTDESFPEDEWVGRVLRIGTTRLRVDKRDGRCVVITIDPDTRERDPAVLRAVARERQGCLGVYATTVQPGRIAVDDVLLGET